MKLLFCINTLLFCSPIYCVSVFYSAEYRNLLHDKSVTFGYYSGYLNITFDNRTSISENVRYITGHVYPTNGRLIHVKNKNGNHFGCTYPFNITIPNEKWIALISGGKCNYLTKINLAQRSNATGVIIYEDRNITKLEPMGLRLNGNISAVRTYKWIGEELAELVDNNTSVFAQITVGRFYDEDVPDTQKKAVFFFLLTIVLLVATALLWTIVPVISPLTLLNLHYDLSKRIIDAAESAISQIPTIIYPSKEDFQGETDSCVICLEPYKVSEIIRNLPCRHIFHQECIDPWLLDHRTCPMCKVDILRHYGFVFSGSAESIVDIEEIADYRNEAEGARRLSLEVQIREEEANGDILSLTSHFSYSLADPNSEDQQECGQDGKVAESLQKEN